MPLFHLCRLSCWACDMRTYLGIMPSQVPVMIPNAWLVYFFRYLDLTPILNIVMKNTIFLQFDAVENGIQVSKLMQIFSKQAAMVDALISHFTDQIRNKKQEGNTQEPFHDGKSRFYIFPRYFAWIISLWKLK